MRLFSALTVIRTSLLVVLISSCAVPVAPTGGPPDSTPPTLVSSRPENGATSVTAREIELVFSEPVDPQSISRAVSLTPEPGGPLEIDVRAERVRIGLPESLRATTTYILSIDNNLRDIRNVAINRPITVAFSTGDAIDRGELGGRVIRATDGQPAAGIDVFLYSTPDSSLYSGAPLYRTQTGRDGRFTFVYLRDTTYFAVAVADANGNRRLDAGERLGVPPQPSLRASIVDSTESGAERPWVISVYDPARPDVDRVRASGASLLVVRFSEPVRILDHSAGGLTVTDTVRGLDLSAEIIFQADAAPSRDVGVLLADTLQPGEYRLTGEFAVADSAGNRPALLPDDGSAVFSAPEGLTDPEVRVTAFLPDTSATAPSSGPASPVSPVASSQDSPIVLWPGTTAGLRLNRPAADSVLERMTAVVDTSGMPVDLPHTRVGSSVLFPAPEGREAPFQLRVTGELTGADSAAVLWYRRALRSDLGEIAGVVDVPKNAEGPVIAELYRAATISDAPIGRVAVDETGRFLFDRLPGGLSYRLRLYVDADTNRTWTPGRPVPYSEPEPVIWYEGSEPVRARWETVIADTLRFGAPPAR